MSGEPAVASEKELAADALRRMPESATLRQISEELALLAALRESEADAAAGRVVSHAEVRRMGSTPKG